MRVDCQNDELLQSGLETLTYFIIEQSRIIIQDTKNNVRTATEIMNSSEMKSIQKYQKYAYIGYQYISTELSKASQSHISLGSRRVYYDLLGTLVFSIIRYFRDCTIFMFALLASFKLSSKSIGLIPIEASLHSENLQRDLYGEKRDKELAEVYRKHRMMNY